MLIGIGAIVLLGYGIVIGCGKIGSCGAQIYGERFRSSRSPFTVVRAGKN